MESLQLASPVTRSEPWNSPRSLRRAFMRAGVGSVVFLLLSGINVFWAAGAWVFVPIALFEFWCHGWVKSGRDEWKAGIGSFVLASVLLVGASFQAIYAEQVLSTSSITAGLDAIWQQIERWAHKDPLEGGPLVVVWGAQCLAIACVASVLRLPLILEPGESVVTLELSVVIRRVRLFGPVPRFLVVAAPLADWVAYGVARSAYVVLVDRASLISPAHEAADWASRVIVGILGILVMAGICAIPLCIGSIICTPPMVFAWWVVDRVELALWPASGVSHAVEPSLRP